MKKQHGTLAEELSYIKRMPLVFMQKYCINLKYNYYYFMLLIIIKSRSIKAGRYMFSKKTKNKFGFSSHT